MKNKWTPFKITLLIVGVLFLVVLIFSSQKFRSTKNILKEFSDSKETFSSMIDKFIYDVGSNQIDDAYQLTDKTMDKKILSSIGYQTLLKDYVKQTPDIYSKVTAISLLSGKELVTYRTTALFGNGKTGQIETTFFKDNDAWKISTIIISRSPDKIW